MNNDSGQRANEGPREPYNSMKYQEYGAGSRPHGGGDGQEFNEEADAFAHNQAPRMEHSPVNKPAGFRPKPVNSQPK